MVKKWFIQASRFYGPRMEGESNSLHRTSWQWMFAVMWVPLTEPIYVKMRCSKLPINSPLWQVYFKYFFVTTTLPKYLPFPPTQPSPIHLSQQTSLVPQHNWPCVSSLMRGPWDSEHRAWMQPCSQSKSRSFHIILNTAVYQVFQPICYPNSSPKS